MSIRSVTSCPVTQDDFYEAMDDVRGSMGTHDYTERDADLAMKEDVIEKDESNSRIPYFLNY